MNELAAFLTTLSSLNNIAKGMFNIRDSIKINAKLIELQGAIITAQQHAIAIQQSYAALETKARDLETECMHLKDWSAEKQNYALREIAPGVFAYVPKDVMNDFQSSHKYCSNCFDAGEKSMLQQSPGLKRDFILTCPRCKFKVQCYHYKGSGE